MIRNDVLSPIMHPHRQMIGRCIGRAGGRHEGTASLAAPRSHRSGVQEATVHYATDGVVSTADLWWLFEEHQITAPAGAWLMAAMWEQ